MSCQVQYLINLRHLHLQSHTKLPPNIGRLTCLQTLEYYHVGKEKGHRIGELGSLENLQGNLHIYNLENVCHQEEAESAHIFEKPKILKLVLEWSTSREGEMNDKNVLEGLRPHPNLKSLKIIGFKGTSFSSWTSNMVVGLYNLVKVSIKDVSECEEIPMMGHLPHLKSLTLLRLRNVKSIRSSFIDSCCKERIVAFPVLQRLVLADMPNLVEWIEIELAENHPLEIKVFPCLEHLAIYYCRELRMDPSQFSSCHKELNSGLHICGSLTKLHIEGVDELEYLPDWFLNNKNLLELRIWVCGKLKELPLHTLNSLEVLHICSCPNLKSIPYRRSQGLTSLASLSINNCRDLISLPPEMLESCAPSLERLSLSNLSSLINLPKIMQCLPKIPLLKSLSIGIVPKLILTTPIFFDNLEYLIIKPAASDPSNCAKKAIDGMLQASSHSLGYLELGGMEDWDSLPHSLQHLKALSRLELSNFKIEELPQWFGKLTSLQELQLSECKELRSVKDIRGLKKLTKLRIEDCHPLLKSWIEQHSDDVSHIPTIWVDDDELFPEDDQ